MIYDPVCLPGKEAPCLAIVRCTDVQSRPTEFLDFASVTLEEFQSLLPSFAAAFQTRITVWCLDATPRTARRLPDQHARARAGHHLRRPDHERRGHYPPTGKLRVYRSRTGGNGWEALTQGLLQRDCYVKELHDAMAVDALDPCGLYVGTTGGQLYGAPTLWCWLRTSGRTSGTCGNLQGRGGDSPRTSR
jgi:hypothetical protein